MFLLDESSVNELLFKRLLDIPEDHEFRLKRHKSSVNEKVKEQFVFQEFNKDGQLSASYKVLRVNPEHYYDAPLVYAKFDAYGLKVAQSFIHNE
ncbi:hypothetical protein KCM76_17825 [Zooshikella marina]|uniref:hypothetical protein n=1 Tax=Zooshikella ganghwensis TaxID=202772 RepID=UPI001BAF47B3|nr:hypothetical protein [Zooshikella ganghwensis]MBU2707858.1 hypothetical protein [Zooshikella ganghwensis]